MSRLQSCFATWKASGRKALIPYLVAGDPKPEGTVALMHDMVAAGADIIELGVPFSDPMADGPVIARGHERALAHGVSLRDVLGMARTFRQTDQQTPLVLMGYLNPVEAMGYATFANLAAQSGIDGVLTVDMPPEEGEVLLKELEHVGIDPVFLLAPTTTEKRARMICARAKGYVYYVSLKGVTGSARIDVDDVATHVHAIRQHCQVPIGVGFGIRDAVTAAAIAAHADAVVVGSALVQLIEEQPEQPGRLTALIRTMRAAMDQLVLGEQGRVNA